MSHLRMMLQFKNRHPKKFWTAVISIFDTFPCYAGATGEHVWSAEYYLWKHLLAMTNKLWHVE